MNFNNKKIIFGITGSIAAYKTPILVREFLKLGAEVRIVATQAAKEFVSMLVLENLTRNPVIIDMFDKRMQGQGAWHVELAHWCDTMLIAPCSATTLSKLATGNCDNALSCVAIALPKEKPLIIAPAMDFTMYEHPTTQKNIQLVKDFGAKIIEPAEGELASGLVGKGRLPEFEIILNATNEILNGCKTNVFNAFHSNVFHTVEKILKNKKILITAGATQEKIDDVRYISNYSTGKMGYALAKVANLLGAEVTLISGQTGISKPTVSNFIQITSAEEMFNAVQNHYKNQEIIIMSAAVADFTPIQKVSGKIKKQNLQDNYSIQLKKTTDILKWLGENKQQQFVVGFALEAENEIENGKKKLAEKNCDIIIINSTNKKDSGFGGDNNTISIFSKDGELKNYEPMSKEKCAENILIAIAEKLTK
jgi:phosphopantothenoylcysteine decarboxylase / phosphopantothenate---cysteine ligase